MVTKKSTQRRGRSVSLRVTYNAETNVLRAPAFIEIGGELVANPIFEMLRDIGPPPAGKPALKLIQGGR